MKRLLAIIVLLAAGPAALAEECVVVMHGLIRSSSSMEPMRKRLAEDGYATFNVSYPSRDMTIEELAPLAVEQGLEGCRASGAADRIHFVTHSMGGILVRQYLSDREIPELGRVVMMGPPNQGSAAADVLRELPGYDWINGPAGAQLGKGEDSVPLKLGPADFEVGIIAGNRTIDPLTSAVLDDPDDGRVSVDDTKLEGMKDFVVVDASHALMMQSLQTIDYTLRFLRDGTFGVDTAE